MGLEMQDARCGILDAGCLMLDEGFRCWVSRVSIPSSRYSQDMVNGFDSWLNGYLGSGLLLLGRFYGWGVFIGAASAVFV